MMLLNNVALNAQHLIISSLGVYNSTNCISNPIQVKSVSKCLDVQTGIAVLNGYRNLGDFLMDCEVSLHTNKIEIKMFPVPVQNAAIVKYSNSGSVSDEYTISIWSINGILLLQQKELGSNLFNGVTLNVVFLPPSTYLLKIESSLNYDILKFIKSN